MNIFILDENPVRAARMQCDRHVVKMTLETAQMLSTVINELGGQSPYKTAHVNHPCSVWARQSVENFRWLYRHGMALSLEYTKRYGKIHKSEAVIRQSLDALPTVSMTPGERTPFPLCMPDKYKSDDAVESYRRFYIGEKSRFAQWNKTTAPPAWWSQEGE